MNLNITLKALSKIETKKPTSVAQLDVHPTGDQEVIGSTSSRSATVFCGD